MKKLFSLICIFLIFSCKKEDAALGEYPTTNIQPSKIDGIVRITKYTNFGPGYVSVQHDLMDAVFYDSLENKDIWNQFKGIDAGKLKLNNSVIPRVTNNASVTTGFYWDGTRQVFTYPLHISVGGTTLFPKSDFIDKEEQPNYYGYYKIPDTLCYSKFNSFAFEDAHDYGEVQIRIGAIINTVNVAIYLRTIKGPVKTITFTKQQMDTIKVGLAHEHAASLQISLFSRNFLYGNGKTIEVLKKSEYLKDYIYIKD